MLMSIGMLTTNAIMGWILLGHYDMNFSSFSVSIMSCFNMILGEFDKESIIAADSSMGPIFFGFFMFIFNIIIIKDHFVELTSPTSSFASGIRY